MNKYLLILSFTLFALAGCNARQEVSTETSMDPKAEPTLVGPQWRLIAIGEQNALAGKKVSPYIQLHDNGSLSGYDGCNRLISDYKLDKDMLQFGQIAGTFMLCPKGQQLSAALAEALKHTHRWQINNGLLILMAEDGVPMANFAQQAEK